LARLTVAENIRRQRVITQAQFAHRVGLSQSAVSRIEAGQSDVTVGQLAIIALALGVPIKALFEGLW
jgi:transcriptional regulator with XRE-family HTH domain